ncbi:hypothetical protein OPT61_g5972 [Boeremia exigua]|uniref:Uncharacterized protein n=1 Tax=Boeremia exigua TaxID=749465 RepID=A0ACC2I8D7_9PLEO|nr:hypothetical protein OPT61_g5972 [Boeremia exigua]
MENITSEDATSSHSFLLITARSLVQKDNVMIFFSTVLLYVVLVAVYRLYFHSLSKYPGPKLAAVTIKTYEYHFLTGDMVRWVKSLHEKYGEVVRYGPNHLSYTAPQAWKDIYGHRTATHQANPKNPTFSAPKMDGHASVIAIEDEATHGRRRRIFSHAFSDRALMEQQDLVERYVRRLIELVRTKARENRTRGLDIVKMYNWTTFDIIGDLTFGEDLENLASGKNSAWIDLVFKNIKTQVLGQCIAHYQLLAWLMRSLTPKSSLEQAQTTMRNSHDSVGRRLKLGKEGNRPDIWGLVLKNEGMNGMPRGEMDANSFLFMVAGSETTATLMSGATWLLLKNPDKYKKLTAEIRAVQRESDIDAASLRHMKYLVAVIEEALRWYPPVPFGLERLVPKGGNRIMDDVLPENVIVVCHSPHNFLYPDEFIPERWIPEETDYKKYHEFDRREASQPFSTGPRNCLGKNLAYYEMRAILARMLFNFDFELCPESEAWGLGQKSWALWEKPELRVRIIERDLPEKDN